MMLLKKYNISRLLANQPKRLKSSLEFKNLLHIYKISPNLQKLNFKKKTYSIINKALVEPADLEVFYYRNKVIKNSFFPLFLRLKKNYYLEIETKKAQKIKFVNEELKKLPQDVKLYLRFFRDYEKKFKANHPLFTDFFYPTTKKKTRLFLKKKTFDWFNDFKLYIDSLKTTYKPADYQYLQKIIALFVFKLPPDFYDEQKIKKQFRKLSNIYHPDKGGSNLYFNELQDARNILLKEVSIK